MAGLRSDWKPFHFASALSQLHVPSTSESHNLEAKPWVRLHAFVTGLSAIKTKLRAAFCLFGPYLKRKKEREKSKEKRGPSGRPFGPGFYTASVQSEAGCCVDQPSQ